MTALVVKTEVGWVAVAHDILRDGFGEPWDEAWRLGKSLVTNKIAIEADSCADEYLTNPAATIDKLPVFDDPMMRGVLLESLARKIGAVL